LPPQSKLIGGDGGDPSARADGYGPVEDKAELARTDASEISRIPDVFVKQFPSAQLSGFAAGIYRRADGPGEGIR
jgi:hypothetical protein